MCEIWKDIEGYEGIYQVSNFGNVKSLSRLTHFENTHKSGYRLTKERILKSGVGSNGYSSVVLRKDGKSRTFMVHRLVALTFIPNLENLPEINHKDENKQNNHINNLEWCSHIYNGNYGTSKERIRKALTGLKRSDEFRKKDSEIKKRWWRKQKLLNR